MGNVEYKEDQTGAERIELQSRVKVDDAKVSMVRGKHLEIKMSMPFDADVFKALGECVGEYGGIQLSVAKSVDVDKEAEKQNYELSFEEAG